MRESIRAEAGLAPNDSPAGQMNVSTPIATSVLCRTVGNGMVGCERNFKVMEMANKAEFIFDHVRNLWERLYWEVNSILEDEFNFIIPTVKIPLIEFRQFYSQVEPLYAFIATQSIPEARSFIQK